MSDEPFVVRLETETYAHLHQPNCPSSHEVRLIGLRAGTLDMDREVPFGTGTTTKDVIGYGHTFEEAAADAWQKKYGSE